MVQKLIYPTFIFRYPIFVRSKMWLLSSFLFLFLAQAVNAQNACGCPNCPKIIPDNDTIISTINISGALNNNLGTNGQALCRVCISFKHGFVSDLLLRLVSPSGQAITMVAPISQQGFTPGTLWNVCFLPCSGIANPDPGFPAQWSNTGWAAIGNYKGSYYPFMGCLEDFNGGVVNGDWKLVVVDGDEQGTGSLLDWTIEFCDPNGLGCIRCDAKAGNLATYPSVAACRGDSKLLLSIPPKYSSANPAPSAATYGYSYIVSKNDTIKRIQSNADLRNISPGNYTVCGLSYRLSDASKIPIPDNKLTVTALKAQLNAVPATFCGNISTACVPVTVYAPTNTKIDLTTCGCVEINSINYCDAGNYIQKLTSKNGCDSILNITIKKPLAITVITNTTTCQGKPYFFGGKHRTQIGTYRDTLRSKINGCDSVIQVLNLLIKGANITNYTRSICQGDSVQQAGKYYKTANIWRDTVKNAVGCDSILVLDLKIKQPGIALRDELICQNGFVEINGKRYDKTGIYDIKVNLIAQNGCDSVIRLNLQQRVLRRDTLRREICEGDKVVIGGKTYTETGNYIDTLKYINAPCDSVIIYAFIAKKSKITVVINQTICKDDYYTFDGNNIYIEGNYSVTKKSKNGCDSVTILQLKVKPKYSIVKNYDLCFGDTIKVGKKLYTQTGDYRDTLKSRFGCDSLVMSIIIALPKLETYITPTICAPAVLAIKNRIYSQSGTYLDTLQSKRFGCDSIIRTSLTVIPIKDTTLNLSFCGYNTPFPNSGTYIERIKINNGCDSIVRRVVEVTEELKTTIDAQICPGSSYTVNNKKFNTAGTFIVKDTSQVTGCDSIITLKLSVTTQIKVTLNQKICKGDSLVIDNFAFKRDTVANIKLQSTSGCDSIVALTLSVRPTYRKLDVRTLCEGSCLVFAGKTYCKGGVYETDTLSKDGCDSIHVLQITVLKRPVTDISASICQGEIYTLGKKKITVTGFYQDTTKAQNGCDSITSLDLLVKPILRDSLYELICYESSEPIGITRATFKSLRTGCDSVFTIRRVKIAEKKSSITHRICKGGSIIIGNNSYDKTGIFTKVIKNIGTYQCDSTVTLSLTVVDSIVVNRRDTLCNNKPFIVGGVPYPSPGNYKQRLVTAAGCDSIFNLTITAVSCQLNYSLTAKNKACSNGNDAMITLEARDSSYVNYRYAYAKLPSTIYSPIVTLKGNADDTIRNLSAGKYIFRIDNSTGLVRYDTVKVNIPSPLIISAQISNYQGFATSCATSKDASINIKAIGGVSPYRYLWDNGTTAPNRERLRAGRYRVTVTDTLGCQARLDTVLRSPANMQVSLRKKDLVCYQDESGWIEIDSIRGGVAPYRYSFDAQAYKSEKRFSKLEANPHIVSIRDDRGCDLDTVILLTQPPKIVVTMPNDVTIDVGETVKIEAKVNLTTADIKTVQWGNTVTPDCPNCLTATVQPSKSTGYIVTVLDKNNCIGWNYMNVIIKDVPIYIPTAFSPNEDGENEQFTIFGNPKLFKIKSLRIYNRWGDKVFDGKDMTPSDLSQGWNGMFKDEAQQEGVFVYVAEIVFLDNTIKNLDGEVFLSKR